MKWFGLNATHKKAYVLLAWIISIAVEHICTRSVVDGRACAKCEDAPEGLLNIKYR